MGCYDRVSFTAALGATFNPLSLEGERDVHCTAEAEEVFFYIAEGKRLTRSIVGTNWQNKFRADSIHGNQEAFENILLIPLTMIPQMQYYCLKNREDGLKPTVVKRCNTKTTKPERGEEQKRRKMQR